jgi:hypothetical protein
MPALLGCYVAYAHHRHCGCFAKAYHAVCEQRLWLLSEHKALHQPDCHHHKYQRNNGMNWLDVLMVVFSVTAANHLGLVAAVEGVIRHRLPVLNCPRCAAFWSVIMYGIAEANYSLFTIHFSLIVLSVALLAAWAAIWLELFMGFIDQLYLKIYEQIYPTADTPDADA